MCLTYLFTHVQITVSSDSIKWISQHTHENTSLWRAKFPLSIVTRVVTIIEAYQQSWRTDSRRNGDSRACTLLMKTFPDKDTSARFLNETPITESRSRASRHLAKRSRAKHVSTEACKPGILSPLAAIPPRHRGAMPTTAWPRIFPIGTRSMARIPGFRGGRFPADAFLLGFSARARIPNTPSYPSTSPELPMRLYKHPLVFPRCTRILCGPSAR